MRVVWMAKAERWWGGGGGGWTVAFSRADKSKEERAVINVPKWPRVTGRPSPVTALKIGHLHNHPSHTNTATHRLCTYASARVKREAHSHLNASILFSYMKSNRTFLQLPLQLTLALRASAVWVCPAVWTLMTDRWRSTCDLQLSSSLVLGTRQSDTNALLIGLCFSMSTAPLSSCSTAIPHLLAHERTSDPIPSEVCHVSILVYLKIVLLVNKTFCTIVLLYYQ